jgi:hypothetical protein
MFKVILLLLVLVLIVILRYRLSESFSNLSTIIANSGLPSNIISNKAREMLKYNEVPLGNESLNDEVLSILLRESVVNEEGDTDKLFSEGALEQEVEDPEFSIKILDQNHTIFKEAVNQRMLVDNLMNELRKLAKNDTPISVLARKYEFNNIQDPIPENGNENGN